MSLTLEEIDELRELIAEQLEESFPDLNSLRIRRASYDLTRIVANWQSEGESLASNHDESEDDNDDSDES